MMRFFLLPLVLTFVSQCIKAQSSDTATFRLLDLSNNADFDYGRIDSINQSAKGIVLLDSIFRVKNGAYTVYRFLTYSKTILFDESGMGDVNELIILKVDKNKKIVDGYYYLLQNPVMPSTCHLYRVTKKLRLQQKTQISEFRFRKAHQEVAGFEVCEDIPLYLIDSRVLTFDRRSAKR